MTRNKKTEYITLHADGPFALISCDGKLYFFDIQYKQIEMANMPLSVPVSQAQPLRFA